MCSIIVKSFQFERNKELSATKVAVRALDNTGSEEFPAQSTRRVGS